MRETEVQIGNSCLGLLSGLITAIQTALGKAIFKAFGVSLRGGVARSADRGALREFCAAMMGVAEMISTEPHRIASTAFLAVAYAEQRISHEQVWQIEYVRLMYVSLGLTPPMTGEIAADLTILSDPDVKSVLNQQQVIRREGKTLDDPLSHPPSLLPSPQYRIPIRALAGMLLLLSMLIAWFEGRGNYVTVEVTGGIGLAIWVAFEAIAPTWFKGHISWYRALVSIPALLVPLFAGYALYLGFRIRHRVLDRVFDVAAMDYLWSRLAFAGICLIALTFAFVAAARWRYVEIRFLWCRIDLMRGLVSKAFASFVQPRSASEHHKGLEDRTIEELLHSAARVMSLNPWWRVLARLAPLFGTSVGGVLIWYLEPEGPNFTIKAQIAPGAPTEVITILRDIANKHKPVALDAEKYQRAVEYCTRPDGTFDQASFLKIPDRSAYVSLVGYVFARRQAIDTGDTRRCLVYDHSYLRKVDLSRLPRVWPFD